MERFPEIVRSRTGEQDHALGRRIMLAVKVIVDALDIALEALAPGGVRLVSFRSCREFFAEPGVERMTPVLVGSRI